MKKGISQVHEQLNTPSGKSIYNNQLYKGAPNIGVYRVKSHQIDFVEYVDQPQVSTLSSILDLQGKQSLCAIRWDQETTSQSGHLDHHESGGLALIFAGSIDNAKDLTDFLYVRGLLGDTTSEAAIVGQLIKENLKYGDYTLSEAIGTVLSIVQGTYSLIVMATRNVDELITVAGIQSVKDDAPAYRLSA